VNVIRHHFHRLDQHSVLRCCCQQNMLEPFFHFTNKNFAPILWAPHEVIAQVKYRAHVLDVPTWLEAHIRNLPDTYSNDKSELTCRLKSAVRVRFTYRAYFTVKRNPLLPPTPLAARFSHRAGAVT